MRVVPRTLLNATIMRGKRRVSKTISILCLLGLAYLLWGQLVCVITPSTCSSSLTEAHYVRESMKDAPSPVSSVSCPSPSPHTHT